jgi:hypothetical protein
MMQMGGCKIKNRAAVALRIDEGELLWFSQPSFVAMMLSAQPQGATQGWARALPADPRRPKEHSQRPPSSGFGIGVCFFAFVFIMYAIFISISINLPPYT